jgi:tetratricopeptide (TPR) repeat protein
VLVAERLGAAGFEPLLVSLILLEVVLPYLGRTPEAEAAATRAVGLARSRGDKLHLASAINNRRNLLVANKDLAGAIADQRTFREIGRELGLSLPEYFAEYNLAELHYQSGDLTLAYPFAARAVRFEEWMPQVAPRPVARLLEARIAAFQGLAAEATVKLSLVRQSTEKARAAGHAGGLLLPSEEVLASMVELSSRSAGDDEWDALLERSTRESLEQEPIEVLELRALSARRQGRNEVARLAFEQALALAAKVPNLLEPRLRAGLALAS